MDIQQIAIVIENNPAIYEILKYCPYEILKHWEIRRYNPGSIICRQGEVYDEFYIIAEGYVDIYVMAENGKKYSQAVYKKGNFIGELEIFEQIPYICFVEAKTDLTLLVIQRRFFMQWLELDRNITAYITKIICNQYSKLSQKAGEDTLYSLKQRLCHYILSCCQGAVIKPVEINLEKEQLSDRFAVTSRSINRILQYLKEEDIIEIKPNSIVIKDLDKLIREEAVSRYE